MVIGALAAAMVAQIEGRRDQICVDLRDGSSAAAKRRRGVRAFKSQGDLKTLGASESRERDREGEVRGEEEREI